MSKGWNYHPQNADQVGPDQSIRLSSHSLLPPFCTADYHLNIGLSQQLGTVIDYYSRYPLLALCNINENMHRYIIIHTHIHLYSKIFMIRQARASIYMHVHTYEYIYIIPGKIHMYMSTGNIIIPAKIQNKENVQAFSPGFIIMIKCNSFWSRIESVHPQSLQIGNILNFPPEHS